ncbi:YihY/virulence factor BrkB family protein [Agilicoccus flavus]|uniref:YihY/virulence factor BrkB family protein n=1 Tax=Agilicoccus flavus TaxID=2775968 RepID=UPI001CF69884|nr:YhjD/YihY/BrkB family envelope integrity protein [Agilicoccus flavus]
MASHAVPPPRSPRGLRSALGSALKRVLDARIVRAGMRYHFGRGALLAGGVTWSALLSVSAVLTILVNAGRTFFGQNPETLDAARTAINQVVPGLIDDGSGSGVIDPAGLVVDSYWNPVTLVSTVVVVWTALSVMTGLRRSIRAMFGLGGAPLPIHIGKLRDLLGFLGLVLGVLTSFALTTAVGPLGRPLLTWLGIEDGVTAGILSLAGVLVAGAVDALVFAMLFRVTAGVRVVRRDLVLGSILGAGGSGLLRLAGTSLVGAVQDPVLASFAAVATLALLVNFGVRLALLVAAWTANPPAVPFLLPPETIRLSESPNYVTRSAPHTLAWPYHAVTGSLLPSKPETGEVMDVDTAADGGSDDPGPSATPARPGRRRRSSATRRA